MIKLDQIKINVNDYSFENLKKISAKTLKINEKDIDKLEILKKSIDARRKPNIFYNFSVGLILKNNLEKKFSNLTFEKEDLSLSYEKVSSALPPVVVGFGPSGIFASLAFARMGLCPIILEQGKKIEEREKDVLSFWNERKLNKYSNVQFGEGGAGTFSDGKLNSNVNNIFCKKAIFELFSHGAPEEILYEAKPHIGSDKLKNVVKNIREEIISLGGKFYFSTKFVDFLCKNGHIYSVFAENLLNNEKLEFRTNHLCLCVGHSGRDCFELLHQKGISIKQKPIAMGVRIEQKQKDINEIQYGKNYNKNLPSADYKLVSHLSNGRSIFTFCMCPGGEVVASSSDEGEIVTNGMSDFARDKENANSALLINVNPEDYHSSHPLAGIYFQQKYEKLAFELGGKNYNAPAESVGSFLGKENIKSTINPSYRPNITLTEIKKCLPDFVSESLKEGIASLNQKVKGFAKDENLLIAIESRSSSPITIIRDENFESNIKGLYPIGEGAGYSGGIITSAQDGIKVAQKIFESLKK